jgi:DNA-directed RNA polymerase specialized sigma24 family protein
MRADESGANFESTSWTLIDRLRNGDERQQREAQEVVARTYRPPVYAYLRRKGHQPAAAADICQAFFAEIVLGRRLLEGAAEAKGRLRTLILAALNHFEVDCYRRDAAKRNGTVGLDGLAAEEATFGGAGWADPQDAFDRRWAIKMLELALEECEQHYRRTGKDRNWEVFEARIVRPMRGQCGPAPLAELAKEHAFRDPADVSQAVQTVKDRVKAVLKDVVARTTCGGEQEAEAENREILRLLHWHGKE